jgi:hypothetical protein
LHWHRSGALRRRAADPEVAAHLAAQADILNVTSETTGLKGFEGDMFTIARVVAR